jgi:hypothetical protein
MASMNPRPHIALVSPAPISGDHAPDSFRLGDAVLELSGDAPLAERFRSILADCASLADDASLPSVHCTVDDATVAFRYPGPRLDLAAYLASINGVGAVDGDRIAFNASAEWRGYAANCAMNVTLAVQSDVLFLHAGSVAVRGRAAVFIGPKAAGKTTTSLALAARGHRLLGDEIAAIRTSTREALPFPRAVSLREGIRSSFVDDRLRSAETTEEKYPDGSLRVRVRVSEFSEIDRKPAVLAAFFFLQPFGATTTIERFTPSRDDVSLLEPLGSSLWTNGAAMRRFQLLRLVSGVPCYRLTCGAPDEAAESIERIMEAP